MDDKDNQATDDQVVSDDIKKDDDVKVHMLSPEGPMIPVREKVPEVAPLTSEVEKAKEQLSSTETEKQAEQPVQDVPTQDNDTPPPVVTTEEQTIQHVVDKRGQDDTKVSHLKSADPLTSRADKEEEEFIQHVGEVHGQ